MERGALVAGVAVVAGAAVRGRGGVERGEGALVAGVAVVARWLS